MNAFRPSRHGSRRPSVSFEFSHEIFGSAADPGFAECFEIDDWREYLAAFAEEATV